MEDAAVPKFYHSSIHERRFAAHVCRALPLMYVMANFTLVRHWAWVNELYVLINVATFNCIMYFFLCSLCILTVKFVHLSQAAQEAVSNQKLRKHEAAVMDAQPECLNLNGRTSSATSHMTTIHQEAHHLIVMPNFNELDTLEETLEALSQNAGSEDFRVVLAMEEREELFAWQNRVHDIQTRFAVRFKRILISTHPKGLQERHADGSADAEVEGKGSNLKWAVNWAHQELSRTEPALDLSSVLLTVVDMGCFFHPGYFDHVLSEYWHMRQQGGNQHSWTIWQTPKLAYRSYWCTPMPTRVMVYMSSLCAMAGVTQRLFCSWFRLFVPSTAYTLPLQLAVNAGAWEGDVVSEDEHCFFKCFFYSLYASLALGSTSTTSEGQEGNSETAVPIRWCELKIIPVFLPVKCIAVHSPGWTRARRRAQGLAECSYSFLAAFDLLRTTPRKHYSFKLFLSLAKVTVMPFFQRLIPLLWATACVAVRWRLELHPEQPFLDHCDLVEVGDTQLGFPAFWKPQQHPILCRLSGSYGNWEQILPFILLSVAIYYSFYSIMQGFMVNKLKESPRLWTLYETSDGQIPRTETGYTHWKVMLLLYMDSQFGIWPVLIPFAWCVEMWTYATVCLYGNRVNTAWLSWPESTRAKSKSRLGYGATSLTASTFGPPQALSNLFLRKGGDEPQTEQSFIISKATMTV